jgi:drug/metabolite transporter, DME family
MALGDAEAHRWLRTRALLIAFCGCFVLSLSGLVARQVDAATDFQIIFFRALGLLTGVIVVYGVRHGRRSIGVFRASAGWNFAAAPLQGLSSMLFVTALTHTTVANTMVLLSATPLIATTLAWLFMRERVGRSTVVAIASTMIGIVIMTADGLASGGMAGNLAALGNAFTFSLFILLLRKARGLDLLPAVGLGAVIAATSAACAASNLQIPLHDAAICFLWGLGIQCTGIALITFSARWLTASEIALISMLEFVLAPLWVWLYLNEVPTQLSLLGGAFVLGSVAVWTTSRALTSGVSR